LNFRQTFEKSSYIYISFKKFRAFVVQGILADRKTDKHTWRSWQSIFADIQIIGVFCLPDATHTRHTGCSVHSILLQFPQHTAIKATNPPADETLLDRLNCLYPVHSFPGHILCYAVHLIL